MAETYTAAVAAEKLAQVTGLDASLHIRQLRHWSQQNLFGSIPFSGSGPTAARIYSPIELGKARLLIALTAIGLKGEQLVAACRLFKQMAQEDDAREFDRHSRMVDRVFPFIVATASKGESGWFFRLYTSEHGVIEGGGFAKTAPLQPVMSSIGPVIIVLNASTLLTPLFFEQRE